MKPLKKSKSYQPSSALTTGQTVLGLVGGLLLMFVLTSIIFVAKLGMEGRLPFMKKANASQALPIADKAAPAPSSVAPPIPSRVEEPPQVSPSTLRPEGGPGFVSDAADALPTEGVQLAHTESPPPASSAAAVAPQRLVPPTASPAAESTPAKPVAEPSQASPPSARNDDSNAVLQTLEQWSSDWQRKDVQAYLAHYAADFKPANNMTREAWAQQRAERLGRPGAIEITVAGPQVRLDGQRATVRFTQQYTGGGLHLSETKTLVLKRDGRGWLIVSERIGA